MKLEKDHISPSQFLFAVACFIQASTMLTSFFVPIAKQSAWFCVIMGLVITTPLLLIFSSLMKDYPDKNIIQIYRLVYGPVVGNIMSAIAVWYFMTLTTYNLRDLGGFVKQTIMVDTPELVIMIACMLVCAYGVYHGLRVVTRYSMVFTFLAISIIGMAVLLTNNLWDFGNFLPVFDQPAINYIQGTHIVVNIPFGELTMFLMIAPNVRRGKKSMYFYLWSGLIIGGLCVLAVVVRDNAVLGNIITLFVQPSFETLRLISLTQALSRMEILFAVSLIVLLFFKIMVMYYCFVLAVAHLFKLKSYRHLVLMLGALVVTYTLFLHKSSMDHAAFGRESAPALWMFFEYLMPLSALIIGRTRKLPKKSIQEGVV